MCLFCLFNEAKGKTSVSLICDFSAVFDMLTLKRLERGQFAF